MMDEPRAEIRLNRYLASAGVCSRREADRYLCEGRVSVDGQLAVMGQKVSGREDIRLDGVPVRSPEEVKRIVLAFYKERGTVSSTVNQGEKENSILDAVRQWLDRTGAMDAEGASESSGEDGGVRKRIGARDLEGSSESSGEVSGEDGGVRKKMEAGQIDELSELMREIGRIYPIGRLDKDSEGIILLTNDGSLVNGLLKGRFGHEKEYEVTLSDPVSDEVLQRMAAGNLPLLSVDMGKQEDGAGADADSAGHGRRRDGGAESDREGRNWSSGPGRKANISISDPGKHDNVRNSGPGRKANVSISDPGRHDNVRNSGPGRNADADRKERLSAPCRIERMGKCQFRCVLTEGMNREIRRMAEYFGHHVKDLKRVRFVNITLEGLKPGEGRLLSGEELASLRRAAGLG
ncbi:MAG: hypothetical protein K5989_01680 [Lachnospiraceae bacterium]|nr:hypothetical protein [Lachnospiraceae bacterium]